MVTLAVPELVRVTVWVSLLPTVISPKSRLVGLRVSWPLPPDGSWKLPATPPQEIRKAAHAASTTPIAPRGSPRFLLVEVVGWALE